MSTDHRAGATALAVLACAPRAHECALGAGRFARLLGRASWTLRLRDALADSFAESSDAFAFDPRVCAFEKTATSATSPSFFFVPDATESDACLALWGELERLQGRRKVKLVRVVLGGGAPPPQPAGGASPPPPPPRASQRPLGSALAAGARRFIGVEVLCATGDEFGPDLAPGAAASAQIGCSQVEEMDAESAAP